MPRESKKDKQFIIFNYKQPELIIVDSMKEAQEYLDEEDIDSEGDVEVYEVTSCRRLNVEEQTKIVVSEEDY